jgi:hypothetical protein
MNLSGSRVYHDICERIVYEFQTGRIPRSALSLGGLRDDNFIVHVKRLFLSNSKETRTSSQGILRK